jgi:hypothetical protein
LPIINAANAVSLSSRLPDTISEIDCDNDIDLEVQEDVTMKHESDAHAKASHRSVESRRKDETWRSFVTLPPKASKTPKGESKANINFAVNVDENDRETDYVFTAAAIVSQL